MDLLPGHLTKMLVCDEELANRMQKEIQQEKERIRKEIQKIEEENRIKIRNGELS